MFTGGEYTITVRAHDARGHRAEDRALTTFAQDLDQEIQDFEDDIDLFKYYPVASLGFSIGF